MLGTLSKHPEGLEYVRDISHDTVPNVIQQPLGAVEDLYCFLPS